MRRESERANFQASLQAVSKHFTQTQLEGDFVAYLAFFLVLPFQLGLSVIATGFRHRRDITYKKLISEMTEPTLVRKPQPQRKALTVGSSASVNREQGGVSRTRRLSFLREGRSNLQAPLNPASIFRVRASGLPPDIFSASNFPKASLRDR